MAIHVYRQLAPSFLTWCVIEAEKLGDGGLGDGGHFPPASEMRYREFNEDPPAYSMLILSLDCSSCRARFGRGRPRSGVDGLRFEDRQCRVEEVCAGGRDRDNIELNVPDVAGCLRSRRLVASCGLWYGFSACVMERKLAIFTGSSRMESCP